MLIKLEFSRSFLNVYTVDAQLSIVQYINLLAPELFFLILAHPVYEM